MGQSVESKRGRIARRETDSEGRWEVGGEYRSGRRNGMEVEGRTYASGGDGGERGAEGEGKREWKDGGSMTAMFVGRDGNVMASWGGGGGVEMMRSVDAYRCWKKTDEGEHCGAQAVGERVGYSSPRGGVLRGGDAWRRIMFERTGQLHLRQSNYRRIRLACATNWCESCVVSFSFKIRTVRLASYMIAGVVAAMQCHSCNLGRVRPYGPLLSDGGPRRIGA